MLLKSVFIALLSFSILHADTLKECKTEADKISGCVVKEYDENGNLERETPYKNGKVEGIAKGYDKMGNLHIEMSFLNDMPQGDTRFYTTDKKLLALLKVENGEFISGKCFNDKALTNKDLAEISNTSDEEAYKYLQEICLKSDSNSTLYADTLKECKSDEDKISGCVEREYYSNGNFRRETPYKNNEANGIAKTYYESGKLMGETPYKNDKAEGIAKVYYKNGNLSRKVPYKNGEREGIEKRYDENGNLKIEIPYKNGEKEGIEKEYYSNGNLGVETQYQNGEREGMAKSYFENGNLGVETPYKNGKIEGIEKWYYESGSLASEIPHKNDEAHGNLKYYTEDGELLALLKAENGKITSGKCSNNKAPTNKDLEEIGRFYSAGKAINYLKEICLKSDSK